ncbi:MAG: hypothetical protein ACR2NX_05425 [Chthoniobacterales bacterium]
MKEPLPEKVIVGHRAALRERSKNELCLDLAERHTSHLLLLDCREALRQLRILNSLPVRLWNGTNNLKNAAADAGAAQTADDNEDAVIQARELRSVVVGHYQQIAAALVYERRRPLAPHEQKVVAKKMSAVRKRMTPKEVLRERDLSAVANDCRESIERRKCAALTIKEMREEIDARHRRRVVEAVAATRSPEKSLPPIAERLGRELRDQGKKRFFDKMKLTMQRVTRVTLRREGRASLFPLLSLLAQEWLRDDKQLWKFIEAVLKRWEKDVADPRSVHRRSTVLHQTAEAHRHEWQELSDHMEKIEAFAPNAVDVPHLLREMSCDESAKALAKSKN